ncbi:MAG: telomerase inhibitor [Geoglossum umbratile]|nr:MAG: telomerase inhibitor [Geoglossum umbratile]
MGLAGPRKRTKISHDPNNTNWSRSATTFGHKILTAQGWTPGTFLGAKNAPHAQFHSAASASRIRIALKDDNLGLGAKKGSGQAEGECTGLSAFQGLLGRLNGKTEEEVDKEREAREGVWRETYMEKRWGLVRFVKGGLLVGDEIQGLADDEADRTQRGTENAEGSENCEKLSEERRIIKIKKQKDEDGDDQEWLSSDKPNTDQVLERRAKSRRGKSKPHGSDGNSSTELKARDTRRRTAKRKRSKSSKASATAATATAQLPTVSGLSLSEKGEDKRNSRRQERRARKVIKHQIAKKQVAGESGKECGNQSTSIRRPLPQAGDVIRSESEKASAPLTMPAHIPYRGRNVVRQRYIQQKKKALLDTQALNEILLIILSSISLLLFNHLEPCLTSRRSEEAERDSMIATPIANDANVLSAATGLHPIILVQNVAREHEANRLARFEGFPKQSKLVSLKQQAVDEAEYGDSGCRPGDKGCGVHWNPSVTAEPDLKGLVKRLGECRRRILKNDCTSVAGLRSPLQVPFQKRFDL